MIKQFKAVVAIQAVIYEEDENQYLTNPQYTTHKTFAVVGDTLETCQQRLTQFIERLENDDQKNQQKEAQ